MAAKILNYVSPRQLVASLLCSTSLLHNSSVPWYASVQSSRGGGSPCALSMGQNDLSERGAMTTFGALLVGDQRHRMSENVTSPAPVPVPPSGGRNPSGRVAPGPGPSSRR